MTKHKTGDKVSHKGRKWIVVEQFTGLIRIRSGEDVRLVRANQVQAIQ